MTSNDEPIVLIGQQIHFLIEWAKENQAKSYSLRKIAQAAGLSTQGLTNILDGVTPDPRLEPIRNLCHFFQVSLDYLSCRTEAECRAYLMRRLIERGPPTLQQIATESQQLSPRGRDNVMVVLRWLEISQNH
ncbi:MAG: helix-turn-helix transcriptional regulator [Anaerolineae bacterium]|nr:helix-turn-helix transcriptional regulator [Anaerolineae bacterium]